MSDTQWPQYEVFLQDREGRAHKSVGTVHAADPEMALLNARDVFARRPDCLSLWVVRADQILAKTAAELEADAPLQEAERDPQAPLEAYYVFQKQSQRRTMTFVEYAGEVEARSPAEALQKALVKYGRSRKTYVWWVCPARAITRSAPDDVPSMFAPAHDKPYKHPADFHTFTAIRKARKS